MKISADSLTGSTISPFILPRRDPKNLFKDPVQMTLIKRYRYQGDIGQEYLLNLPGKNRVLDHPFFNHPDDIAPMGMGAIPMGICPK